MPETEDRQEETTTQRGTGGSVRTLQGLGCLLSLSMMLFGTIALCGFSLALEQPQWIGPIAVAFAASLALMGFLALATRRAVTRALQRSWGWLDRHGSRWAWRYTGAVGSHPVWVDITSTLQLTIGGVPPFSARLIVLPTGKILEMHRHPLPPAAFAAHAAAELERLGASAGLAVIEFERGSTMTVSLRKTWGVSASEATARAFARAAVDLLDAAERLR